MYRIMHISFKSSWLGCAASTWHGSQPFSKLSSRPSRCAAQHEHILTSDTVQACQVISSDYMQVHLQEHRARARLTLRQGPCRRAGVWQPRAAASFSLRMHLQPASRLRVVPGSTLAAQHSRGSASPCCRSPGGVSCYMPGLTHANKADSLLLCLGCWAVEVAQASAGHAALCCSRHGQGMSQHVCLPHSGWPAASQAMRWSGMQAMGLVEAAQRLALLGNPCAAAQLKGLTAEGALHLVQDALGAFLKADPPLPESRSVQCAGMLMMAGCRQL